MYLVLAEDYRPSPAKRPPHEGPFSWRRRRPTKQHPHTEWIKLRTKHREAELQCNARTKEIADYMKQIMPAATIPPSSTSDIHLPKPKINQNAEHSQMWRQHLLPPTHTNGHIKRLYTRRRNANLSGWIMIMMIIFFDAYDDEFLEEAQRHLVEKT